MFKALVKDDSDEFSLYKDLPTSSSSSDLNKKPNQVVSKGKQDAGST